MAVHQTSSVLDEMSFALSNKDEMVDNAMTMLPIELTNATGTYLQDLNEDCLLEIFSRNPLTPMDLCSLAETCKRFKQITQRMFSKGFAINRCCSGCMYTFTLKDYRGLGCTFQDTERILKNFGAHLSELCVEGDLALVNLVAQYCDGITLKHLRITYLGGIEGVTQQLNSIFQRLLQLSLYECNLPIEPWDMNCESLIELEIWQCENSAAFLKNNFPILERFTFQSKYDEYNFEALSEFVRRHGYLKSITIFGEPFNPCKLLHAISCSCNELVELTFKELQYAFVDISHLQSLAKLEVLRIGFEDVPMEHQAYCEEIDFSRGFTSLKTMEISFYGGPYVVPNQIFDVLSRLQGLRELKLVNCDLNRIPWTRLSQLRKVDLIEGLVENSNCSALLDVIRKLINLEELKYHNGFKNPLTEEEFRKIVKLVERRAHVLTLECRYNFIYEENCNEKRKVKLIHLYRFTH